VNKKSFQKLKIKKVQSNEDAQILSDNFQTSLDLSKNHAHFDLVVHQILVMVLAI